MNSDKKGSAKLPDGWVLCTSKSNPGRKYYFNKKTGKSSWTQPQADHKLPDNKQKGKKERAIVREKSRKEELQKKNLKRKSDGGEQSQAKKKQKEVSEPPTPEKQNKCKKESPIKCPESVKKKSPIKPSPSKPTPKKQPPNTDTPSKNIANSRLSQLRAQLATETQTEETDKSPTQGNKKTSPTQTDTPNKISKPEDNSPTINETKSTTQSPSSDSFQSMPSPSQFFAANKIISSMKAQLPEKYCNKSKQKDTFADIEEGICNQTAEYPFMKHPATPPQFSEASKLVSAIKSKLTYKVSCKEEDVKIYSSAKERLENLRTRLSSEAMNSDDSFVPEVDNTLIKEDTLIKVDTDTCEAMEVDLKEILLPAGKPPNCSKKSSSSQEDVVLIVDTNIFIHELDSIKTVLNSHIKGYKEQPTLLIPWRVISELDRLKDNNNGNGAICKRAKSAMDYLYKSLPEESRIKGQSLRDANSHIYPCEVPDDEILNCCLQQAERGKAVILLSNDKNLCNKATINSVKSIGLSELKGLLENKPRAAEPDLRAAVEYARNTVFELLSNILENEMRAKYNDLWQYVLFKAPPWTLADVLQCLLKHWIAVFNDVFPRIEHLITDLRNSLVSIESKDLNLSKSEVSSFKELCLEVAKRCQIIPEYMELAKSTVERLQRGSAEDDMLVIDAFEGLWTVFSSYCAKLCTSVGVVHGLEDRVGGTDSPSALIAKMPVFQEHINMLTVAIKGVLSVEPSDPGMEEHMVNFENTFMECLAIICIDGSPINRSNLRIFCSKCRNMLQEAYLKFSQLTEILEVSKHSIASN